MTDMRRKFGPPRKIFYHHGRNRVRANEGRLTYTPRPPSGIAGSDEAILYAGNILYDPGFELFVQNGGPNFLKPAWEAHTGSTVYALPRLDLSSPTGQRWPNGDYVDRKDVAQWAQYTEPYNLNDNVREASAWFVVRREKSDLDYTTNKGPNLGIWMARWYDWNSSGNYPLGNSLPGGLVIQGPGMPAGYSGRTEPGALITWSVYSWLLGGDTTSVTMDLCVQFYRQDGTPIYTAQSANTVTKTKTSFQVQSNTPGGSYFMRACLTYRGTANRGTMVQVDTGLLGVE